MIRNLAAIALAWVVAVLVFVTFSWFGLGIVALAGVAFIAFTVTTSGALRLFARRAGAGVPHPGWTVGAAGAYALAAQLLVGQRPTPALVPPEPAPGTLYWALSTGSRIAYVHTPAAGTRREVPVIMLHDGPGVPVLPQLQRLSARPFDFLAGEGFDVYYYDQFGSGLSSRADPGAHYMYTVGRQVEDLEAIRATLGAPRLLLVGEGWGGSLAIQYAMRHPDRVMSVIVESPAPLWYPAWPSQVAAAARARMTEVQASALALLSRPTPRLVLGRMMADFSPKAAHQFIEDWEADQWWTRWQEESMRLGQPRVSCASELPDGWLPLSGLGFFTYSYTLADAGRLPDPRPGLASLVAPALVIRGSCDYIDWRVSYEYLAALPEARYVAIPAAGHQVWRDQPGLHMEVLKSFVRGEPLPLEFYDPSRSPGEGRGPGSK